VTAALQQRPATVEDHAPAAHVSAEPGPEHGPRAALVVAVLGMFLVTLDALVVNVALPAVGSDLGGRITGLQWVVDGYTLLFAALLLSAGALSDRIGARRAFGAGVAVFMFASAACGLAPAMGLLIAARVAQAPELR
jgi:MFS transporter, DHA2 family, methylenomycin A resistance protein